MLDTVVMSGDDVCCSVVFGTLVGVFVFSVMWSELLMTSAISVNKSNLFLFIVTLIKSDHYFHHITGLCGYLSSIGTQTNFTHMIHHT